MRKPLLYITASFLLASPVCLPAQENKAAEKPEQHFYRLSFTVEEVNDAGKITNSRTYITSIGTLGGSYAQIRTGDKVPLRTDDKGNLNYMDVGVNFDCNSAKDVNNELAVQITSEVSSTAKATDSSAPPVVRQNRWAGNVLVPIGKPIIIFSSDDLQSKGKLQVELTATHIQ